MPDLFDKLVDEPLPAEEQARELSRRARDDLIRYGIVSPGPPLRLAGGAQASAGDLVMARRNTRMVQAGHDGRELANRDVLQILSTAAVPGGARANFINGDGVEVRGERVRGRMLGYGGDWMTVRADGVALLDVRNVIETVEGARILYTYSGIADLGELGG